MKKYIPFYGIKHMKENDFLKMLIYHNLMLFIFIIIIFEIITNFIKNI